MLKHTQFEKGMSFSLKRYIITISLTKLVVFVASRLAIITQGCSRLLMCFPINCLASKLMEDVSWFKILVST